MNVSPGIFLSIAAVRVAVFNAAARKQVSFQGNYDLTCRRVHLIVDKMFKNVSKFCTVQLGGENNDFIDTDACGSAQQVF